MTNSYSIRSAELKLEFQSWHSFESLHDVYFFQPRAGVDIHYAKKSACGPSLKTIWCTDWASVKQSTYLSQPNLEYGLFVTTATLMESRQAGVEDLRSKDRPIITVWGSGTCIPHGIVIKYILWACWIELDWLIHWWIDPQNIHMQTL